MLAYVHVKVLMVRHMYTSKELYPYMLRAGTPMQHQQSWHTIS